MNKVALRLETTAHGGTAAATTSDDAGYFTLTDLDPGVYRLIGRRSGYLGMPYGARRASSKGTMITLEAGQTLDDLSFKLTAGGAVTGTVRDSDGEPVENARVQLSRVVYNNRGRPRLEKVSSDRSDDRGEYRVHGLWPGGYYVSASDTQSPWIFGAVDGSTRSANDTLVTTFYPAVPDSSWASPIEIEASATVTGIDVTLLRRPLVCVTGQVVPSASTGTDRRVVVLEAANADIDNYRSSLEIKNANGDFVFCRVPSGSYSVSAYSANLSARVLINVGSIAINDIRLPVSQGADVHGHVRVEGSEKLNFAEVRVEISQDGNEPFFVRIAEDGKFTIPNWRPGHYDVGISTPPNGFYVSSIQSGEVDVLVDGLTISESSTVPLEIVLSADGSELSGVILDKDKRPVGGAMVVLVPNRRSRLDLFKTTTTDQYGSYQFSALAPANYKVFAWDDVDPNAWYAPDFLGSHEEHAEKVTLEPNMQVNVDLRIADEHGAR